MSTQFPLYVVLLELTELLHRRNVAIDLQWRRREDNTHADALTNGDFSQFSGSLRLNPDVSLLAWEILPRLYNEALELHETIQQRKVVISQAGKDSGKKVGANAKRRRIEPLKTRDPW